MRDLKCVDESPFRENGSVELEDETRQEYQALLPRFKARRNGEWCFDSKLHERARKVDEKFAEFVKQPYIEFRWLVNSEWRCSRASPSRNADALLQQRDRAEKFSSL